MIVISRAHDMPRDEIRHVPSQRVAEFAGSTEVDTAEDASVSDFCNGAGETGERTSAGTGFGGDGKRRIVSKPGGEDQRRRAANRGMG